MQVKKQDGTFQEYDSQKIIRNIEDASFDVKEIISLNTIQQIVDGIHIYDNIESKEIRRQVENSLMSVNKKVARSYIKKYGTIEEQNKQLQKKNDFIKSYVAASNPATGSKYNSNANVSKKNVVTMGKELYAKNNIMQNRWMLCDKIRSLFGKEFADQYLDDLNSHRIYKHDETSIPGMPYCVSITMYPFLIDGLTNLGGISKAPTDSKSFTGEFINLVYSVSSQFAGAVATPEYLMYFDYFLRKDYGDDYICHLNDKMECSAKQRTLEQIIENCFQQVVHSMNMPAGNRGYESVFWNLGYFDKYYFEGIFSDFVFPDGTKPKWETLNWLQKKFMKWFNQERTKYVLTFPVETMAMLTDDKDVLDKEYGDFVSEMWAEGHSFFCYLSDSPDSLSSCCRIRNEIIRDKSHNNTTHQFSMGTASVATGSKSVMTLNLNRIIQDAVTKNAIDNSERQDILSDEIAISNSLNEILTRVHKYQTAFNEIIKDFYKAGMLDVYSAGFINMKKQYLTIGVNGLTDAAEFMGLEINDNEEYKSFVNNILETINKCNASAKTKELMFNTEFVPGENLSNKNYNWDKEDGYFVSDKHKMYSSYFYNSEDEFVNILDKMKLHGKDYVKYLDGGSACHLNIKEHLSQEQYRNLLKIAVKNGTNYFTFNCKNTVCNSCGYISKDTITECPHCHSKNVDWITRIIGYLKRVSSFSEARQEEEKSRTYC